MSPKKWAWLIGIVLVILAAIPFVAGLIAGSDFGELSIPKAATLLWQGAIGALIVAFIGAIAIHVDRKREVDALLTLAADDVTHIAERVVQYQVQRVKKMLSKSKLQPALDWPAVSRLCSLAKDQKLADDLYCFYEKVWRAEDSFARASRAVFEKEELAFAVHSLLFPDGKEPEQFSRLDDSEKRQFVTEQEDHFRQKATQLLAVVVERQAAAERDQGTGLVFMMPEKQRDPLEAAVSVVEHAAKELSKSDDWQLLKRVRKASRRHSRFIEIDREGRRNQSDPSKELWDAYKKKHNLDGDALWEDV